MNHRTNGLRVAQTVALLLLAGSAQALSYAIDEIAFEDAETVQGQKLLLNGASTSNILSAKATAVGIYMPQKQTTVESLLGQKGIKRIRLVALRDISSKDLGTVLMDRIRQNATPDEVATNIMQIAQVGSVFASLTKLAKGDVRKAAAMLRDPMMTKTEVARHFGVSRVTLNAALEREGYPQNPAAATT